MVDLRFVLSLNTYPGATRLNMDVSGIIAITKRSGERLSPCKIPLLMLTSPSSFHCILELSFMSLYCFTSYALSSHLPCTSLDIHESMCEAPHRRPFYNQSIPLSSSSSELHCLSLWLCQLLVALLLLFLLLCSLFVTKIAGSSKPCSHISYRLSLMLAAST